MQQKKETLSAYMDGHNVEGHFTETLCRDEQLQATWANYHQIRSLMRGEEPLLGADFSAKMAVLIENESIEESLPASEKTASEKPRGLLLKLRRWSTPLMQAGIAASVCLVAVFGFNQFNASQEVAQADAQPALQTLPFIGVNSISQVSYNAPSQDQPTAEQLEYQQRRINALLQDHELQRRTSAGAVSVSEAEKAKAQTSSQEQKVQPQQP